ncbi:MULTISPECIES: hypothetical protein [Halorussus]|uniref:hypothetical protein n=1 Tax=Halorussus TaxID=1070314 RepID=UPI0020A1CA11|nr:hypothetical protein [Halorussus vallis]USZ74552.1 hypothetical protein NGM07_14005 [Halorussus vallis]
MSADDRPAAEYRITDFAVTSTTERPDAKYVLDTAGYATTEAVERRRRTGEDPTVVEIGEIEDDDVREVVKAAVRTGEWRSNGFPDGLAQTVATTDYFTGVSKGEYTHIGLALYRVPLDGPPAVEFGARVVDDRITEASPSVVELALTNAGSDHQTVFSGAGAPFGVLVAEGADGKKLSLRFEDEQDGVSFTEDGWSSHLAEMRTEISPGERLSRRYRIHSEEAPNYPESASVPGPGAYRVADRVAYSHHPNAPHSTLRFELEFVLDSA